MVCMSGRSSSRVNVPSNLLPTLKTWTFYSSSCCCCSNPCFWLSAVSSDCNRCPFSFLLSHEVWAITLTKGCLWSEVSLGAFTPHPPLPWGHTEALNFRDMHAFPDTPVRDAFLFHPTRFTHKNVSRVVVVCCSVLPVAVPRESSQG